MNILLILMFLNFEKSFQFVAELSIKIDKNYLKTISTETNNIISNLGNIAVLKCDNHSFDEIFWVQTINKTNTFLIESNDRVLIKNNDLIINGTILKDDEYYYCGVINSNGSLLVYSSFYLFIKVDPIISIIIDYNIINETLIYNLTSDKLYEIVCTAFYAKPKVDLSLEIETSATLIETKNVTTICSQQLCTTITSFNVKLKSYETVKRDYITCRAKPLYEMNFSNKNDSFLTIKRDINVLSMVKTGKTIQKLEIYIFV
jgi:hypothetical protein